MAVHMVHDEVLVQVHDGDRFVRFFDQDILNEICNTVRYIVLDVLSTHEGVSMLGFKR